MRPASLFALSLLSLLLAVVGSVVGAPPLYAVPSPVPQQPPPVPPFSAGSSGERAQPVPPQVVGSGVPDASLQSPPPTAAPVPSAGGGAATSEKSTPSRPEIIFPPVAFLSNPVSGPIPQEHVFGGCY
jgi:hypothetical protein